MSWLTDKFLEIKKKLTQAGNFNEDTFVHIQHLFETMDFEATIAEADRLLETGLPPMARSVPLAMKGVSLFRLKRYAEAAPALREGIDLSPLKDSAYKLSVKYHALALYEEAARKARVSQEYYPTLETLNEIEKAFIEALVYFPDNEQILRYLGHVVERRDFLKRSRDDLSREP